MKSGALGGFALKADETTPETGITVKATNAIGTIWTTTINSSGAFRLYLAPGKYTLVVSGESTAYKNISTTINVVAGKMSGSLTDSEQVAWTGSDNMLVYKTTAIKLNTYTIALTSYPVSGETIVIRVTDPALNIYESSNVLS